MTWTKTPPTNPGWYWRRDWKGPNDWTLKAVCIDLVSYYDGDVDGVMLHARGDPWREVDHSGKFAKRELRAHPRREWWPEPIVPPETPDVKIIGAVRDV